ncbi:hypothetical protein [Rhizobium sp. MHM7A]|uniref:hypothetical protein n=1 Tax=Rhizobium sp. MHM7A TaxID=2583233 RepID=UPI0011072D50|nr:hypothetical protein [Rhizobium sp. MHM7A]TLX16341.1 hypothetical protein FFR93_03145 [Rhizobium sp. MHM7A]
MVDQENLSGKRALMAAAADRIAAKQQAVIDDFETSIAEKIDHSTTESAQSVRDFLIEDD